MSNARAWQQAVTIPTYGVGKPDRNPMFLEKRVYQGSSGAVYPLPVIDKILDEKRDQTWQAVFLENDYIQVMLLPQLGGRVQTFLDKTNQYDCVYRQHVIKPALVGLAGPWISGGIEFNWPQHHRPSTFMPLDYRIAENPDGSKTVWVSDIDRMNGTRALTGFTIHPDRAYLEIKVRLFNGTPLPQTFLWWANPACHVDENHQSVFPPDVHAVMDHGKRDVSSFPIATGTYYKVNYAPGTDISRYANIPVPTSYMAYHSDFNFVASYDHGRRAGLLHVADHHVSPGKKQWTWGNGDFGQAWDRQLTDSDGPYIELMCGVFTDNQPDFSWLNPYEEKSFTQYFMPYKQVGRIKNASIEAAINLEMENGQAYVAVYVTSPREKLRILLNRPDGTAVLDETTSLSPEKAFEKTVTATSDDLRLTLFDQSGNVLLSYSPAKVNSPIPEPARGARTPEETETNEALYLTGLHLEQYRHATWEPEPYYREAIRRDAGDIRNNNALGLLLFRRGEFAEAEKHFRAAIQRLTTRNPNPYDGEPSYNLGLALRMQGRWDEAADAFQKAAWNASMRMQAFFQLAQLASRRGNVTEAISFCEQSLIGNWHHHKARYLKTNLLKKLNQREAAAAEEAITRSIDPMFGLIRAGEPQDRIELGLDLINSGFYEQGIELLTGDNPPAYPMLWYLAGWAKSLAGDEAGAAQWFERASNISPELCFPSRLEELLALQQAVKTNPRDGRAWYLLGNLLYAKRVHEKGIAAWKKSIELAPTFATSHRNLALGYFNRRHDPKSAMAMLQKAFSLDQTDARVLYELDQLAKKINQSPSARQQFLQQHMWLAESRDDLFVEYCNLLNLLGNHDQVQEMLAKRNFHPWEGGEGKVTGAYVYSLLETAKQNLTQKNFDSAVALLNRARTYPNNLGEGKLPGALENDLDYFQGLALGGLNQLAQSREFLERASIGLEEPVSAMFYNDQPPHTIFYQGLACLKLGREADAQRKFKKLIDYADQHMNDHVTIDYFAVSLPEFLVFDDDLDRRNQLHCHYMKGLGLLGLGDLSQARAELEQVLKMDASHLGATAHLKWIDTDLFR